MSANGGGQMGRSNSLKRKHWSIRAHESLVSRNNDGHFCLNVEGGAENGLFPLIGELKQDRINYKMGKLQPGELILEVNHKRVPGMIKKDVIALIKRSADPVSLITVKQNATITKDIRQYLVSRFTKNSVDSELQHQIRENLHTRVIPCTTRKPREGERDGVEYNFITVDEFKKMDKRGELLESGTYENNYYGTPKPPADPSHTMQPSYLRTSANFGYGPREPLVPIESSSSSSQINRPSVSTVPRRQTVPNNLGPLPSNWEIAYTENNEKYFIDHNTGTTHWLDPRLARIMPHSLLDCGDEEIDLPYGWEKVNDPVCGIYFIDHINRTTQYENPVVEAKRKLIGSQLQKRSYSMGDAIHTSTLHSSAPPPMRAPPSFQTAAALEKQREAEAAQQWPNAGLMSYQDSYNSYPQQVINPVDIEANLSGEAIRVSLIKNPTGFGFTIIGGDRPGELLQIRSIVQGGVADRDGRLKIGDVLVRVNRESVVTYSHHKVVDLFQSIPMHSQVDLEIRRGYPLPDIANDELPSYSESNLRQFGNRDYPDQGHPDMLASEFNRRFNLGPLPPPERLIVSVVKGPLGFGFSLSETAQGPVVKQIMDIPRCAQLREGDLIMEVNGEKVVTYSHNDLITLLKRCPKGNQANFLVMRSIPASETMLRQNSFQDYPQGGYQGPNGYPQYRGSSSEPFQFMEVRLIRQVSGFGFRVIGGKEEGSQTTIGGIVPGGAADIDGRIHVGDELTHINGVPVVDATHSEVIQLISDAGAQGEVILGIRRKMPLPISGPTQIHNLDSVDGGPHPGAREVIIERPNMQTSFGFVLQSNTLRQGCMICRLIEDSPAERCGQLYLYDELLVVNGVDVTQMDHGDIVQLIKSSGSSIKLVVQQPENKDEIHQMQQLASTGKQSMQPAMAVPQPGPDGRQQDYQGRYPLHDGGDEVGPQISADIDGIEDEEIIHLDLHRTDGGFGFSIRGGAEYNSHLFVLRIAEGGAADRDGRLQVNDELLEINGNSTEGMLHSDAITIIKHGGDIVRLIIRRVSENSRRFSYTDPISPVHHRMNSTNSQGERLSREFSESRSQSNSRELLNGRSPRASNAHERYTRDYMNSLGRNNKIQDQYGPDGSRDGLDHDPSDDQ